jgi:Tol biopolymer transport system component
MHSPGDERLLYVNGKGEIVSSFTDGTDAHAISPSGWNCWTPAWSPDAKQVVFASDHTGNPVLYVMGADGSSPTQVFPWEDRMFDYVQLPSWSSKGVLAFEAFHDFSSGPVTSTWTVMPDGTGLIDVTLGDDDEGAPAWSPDGSALALHSGGNLWVWRSANDASQLTMPVTTFADPVPTWTPDGKTIIYSMSDSTVYMYSVHRIGADGTGDTELATPQNGAGRPSVSRDGKTIAFDAAEQNIIAFEIDTIPIAGGTPARLLLDSSNPQYQP